VSRAPFPLTPSIILQGCVLAVSEGYIDSCLVRFPFVCDMFPTDNTWLARSSKMSGSCGNRLRAGPQCDKQRCYQTSALTRDRGSGGENSYHETLRLDPSSEGIREPLMLACSISAIQVASPGAATACGCCCLKFSIQNDKLHSLPYLFH
jgi:hypothetical protein